MMKLSSLTYAAVQPDEPHKADCWGLFEGMEGRGIFSILECSTVEIERKGQIRGFQIGPMSLENIPVV
jgi:hypothetical protein